MKALGCTTKDEPMVTPSNHIEQCKDDALNSHTADIALWIENLKRTQITRGYLSVQTDQ